HPWLLPFDDESLDIVLCNGVLEHAANEQRSLTEIHRVLRDNGRFIASAIPCRSSLVEWFNRTMGRPYHPRLYTFGGVKRLLLSTGLHPIWIACRVSCPLAVPWADPIF